MKRLDLTLPTVAENLALDEALLEGVSDTGDLLRLWESDQAAVVVGRASRVSAEVNEPFCRHAGIPILRRCSGGAAVVLGPGCLMYAVLLQISARPELHAVDHAHRFVLGQLREALQRLELPVELSGTSDLTMHGRKFSGNSMRCKRDALLYHGTLLYAADLRLISACLTMPPRQPEYRQQRSHEDFLVNLPARAEPLRQAIGSVWQCTTTLDKWPSERTRELVVERYTQPSWNQAR
jgi:lipoate-protein ligase A